MYTYIFIRIYMHLRMMYMYTYIYIYIHICLVQPLDALLHELEFFVGAEKNADIAVGDNDNIGFSKILSLFCFALVL